MGGCNLIATEHGIHGRYAWVVLYAEGCGVSSAECLDV